MRVDLNEIFKNNRISNHGGYFFIIPSRTEHLLLREISKTKFSNEL